MFYFIVLTICALEAHIVLVWVIDRYACRATINCKVREIDASTKTKILTMVKNGDTTMPVVRYKEQVYKISYIYNQTQNNTLEE